MKLSIPLLAVISGSVVHSSDAWNNQVMLFTSPFNDVATCRQESSACSPIGRMIREQEKIIDREMSKIERDFPSRRGVFARSPMLDLMEKQSEMLFPNRNKFFSSPGQLKQTQYEVTHTDEDVKVALDVPGIKLEDIDISVDSERRLVTISGSRDVKDEGYRFTSKFSESFYLKPNIDMDNLTANLQDGVLVVRAPKKEQESTVRRIPIESLPSTTKPEMKNEAVGITMTKDESITENLVGADAGVTNEVTEVENNSNDDDGEVIDLSDDPVKQA
jgi:HSP20 family molecular chaperone IbpA